MFADASQRKFDLVLFWSLDRFSREGVLETLNHLQRLLQYGVGYRSFTEQYLDSCGIFKDAVLSILATIAKQERVRLSERVMAGLEKAHKQGRIGGRRPLVVDRDRISALDAQGWTTREMGSKSFSVPPTKPLSGHCYPVKVPIKVPPQMLNSSG
jgi:DNA invertase Pin-like site-specific DNA recombinase